MRKIARAAIKFMVFAAAARLVGRAVSHAYEGDSAPDDDDFRVLAFWDGRTVDSKASALRTGTAVALLGGVDIDLRSASLDPGGAYVSLRAYMGGIRLLVPDTWKVYVEEDLRAGGIDVATPGTDDVDDDAPRLTVEAAACCGGIQITTQE